MLHSPPVEKDDHSRSSSYFPPTRLSYFPSRPVYPIIGPAPPPVPTYMYHQPYYQQPDLPQDRIDSVSLPLLSLLPSLLKSVVVPVLAAGSAVWLSQNLPTPVVQERRRRSSEVFPLSGDSQCI